jgi:uncharacterized repeat protein (TIGR03803 family)
VIQGELLQTFAAERLIHMTGPEQHRSRIFGMHFCAVNTALALTIMFVLIVATEAQAQVYSVLHYFTGAADGAYPWAGLAMDKVGNLYGTNIGPAGTGGGGSYGTIFKLSHKGSGWVFSPLYSFAGGSDGAGPAAPTSFGADGILYGTTGAGGPGACPFLGGYYYGCGTVFSLRPPEKPCTRASCPWTKTVLYRFTGGSDGGQPGSGPLIFDAAGNIYGTTNLGGVGCAGLGCGTVFQLTHSGSGWIETVIYSFQGSADGGYPIGGIIFDAAGNIYGTTAGGGSYGNGTVFELTHSQNGWTKTTLYDFPSRIHDGDSPMGGVILDSVGNLYGTTSEGGGNNGGTVFELTPSNGSWSFTLLASLLQTADDYYGTQGPQADLVMDVVGNLYGTTNYDGAYGLGNVFEVMRSSGGWTYVDLHDFNGGNGEFSFSSLVFDSKGNLYGTTSGGGGFGLVFEVTPD